MPESRPGPHFSREQEIKMLAGFEAGKTNQQIADELGRAAGVEIPRKKVANRLRKLREQGVDTVAAYKDRARRAILTAKSAGEVAKRTPKRSAADPPKDADRKPSPEQEKPRADPVFFSNHISPKWDGAKAQIAAKNSALAHEQAIARGEAKEAERLRQEGKTVEEAKRAAVEAFLEREKRGEVKRTLLPAPMPKPLDTEPVGLIARPGVYRKSY